MNTAKNVSNSIQRVLLDTGGTMVATLFRFLFDGVIYGEICLMGVLI